MWIRFLIVLSSICAHLLCEAQNILKYKCLFKTGDDMEWSQIGFDDADWDQIIIGKPWEHQGWEGYDGYAWYRQKVAPKTEIKKSVEQAGGLQLLLGKIDDVSAVFWNGEKLGGAGTFPPNYQTGYNVPIEILIPFDKINWKAPNVLSIRVYDGGGFGGIIGEAIKLSIPGVPDALAITPRLSSDHQFLTTGPIVFSTQIANNSQQAFRGQVSVSVVSDFGQSILKTSEKKRIPPKKHIDHKVDLGKLGPGFYQVEITLESDIGQAKKRFSIGVRPEDIWSPTNRPDDFQTYWEKAKNELSCIPPQYKLIKLDSLCTDQKEVFLLEMRSLGNVLVRAWYSKPLRPGPYPAILHVQGYSTNAKHFWGYGGNDMATLILNIRGHGNSRDFINPGFPGYMQHMVEDKELYIYRGAYMDCLRALDFLYTQDEIDKSRIAVEGSSQGGALSFATAALAPDRVSLCIPGVPFLSDFEDYFQVAHWPGSEFKKYFEQYPESRKTVMETLSYIDIKNLAPWIKVPVFMGVGLVDPTCPPHINFAAYNQVSSSKEYLIFPEAGHSLPPAYSEAKYTFIKNHFFPGK